MAQTITYTVTRDGTLTTVSATCDNPDHRLAMLKAFSCTSRFTTREGLAQQVSCKAVEAARIVSALDAINAETRRAERPNARRWVERRLVADEGEAMERMPRTIVGADGRTLELTGFGRGFQAGEEFGHLWGDYVRFAYYA